MTQKSRNEDARVVCLFCGSRTFVPASPSRGILNQGSRPGVSLVRCHVCRKEAPYSASEIFLLHEVALADDNNRSRAAGL